MTDLDEILERKRQEAMGGGSLNKRVVNEINNKEAILLSCAAGVLPSVIAEVYGLDRKTVKTTIEDNKDRVQELCRMITTDYQAVRVNMLFDTVISKLQSIIDSDDTNVTGMISAAKEIKAMIKDGDVGKAFNREVMDDTFESAPENVDFMLKRIKEIEDKEKGLMR